MRTIKLPNIGLTAVIEFQNQILVELCLTAIIYLVFMVKSAVKRNWLR